MATHNEIWKNPKGATFGQWRIVVKHGEKEYTQYVWADAQGVRISISDIHIHNKLCGCDTETEVEYLRAE